MNEDIMRMAREAGIAVWHKDLKRWVVEPGLERFAAIARADERKRCAEVAYAFLDDPFLSGHGYATGCRDAILAGSET